MDAKREQLPVGTEEQSPPSSLGFWPFLGLGLLSGLLFWASQPPLQWAWLGPLAPIGWLAIVRLKQLPARHPYCWLWLTAALAWLVLLQGLRHPHPILYAGWFALAFYVACYTPLFVALARGLVHRAGWPLIIAAPTAWVAVELARGHVITGFSMALLGHSLAGWPMWIQIADWGGAYAVGALLVSVAAALVEWLPLRSTAPTRPVWSSVAAIVAVVAAGAYGFARLQQPPPQPQLTIALIQGGRDVFYDFDPKRNQEMYLAYRFHSQQACSEHRDVSLVIWPESSLAAHLPEVVIEGPLIAPPEAEMDDAMFQQSVEQGVAEFRARLEVLAASLAPDRPIDLLVAGETIFASGTELRKYNTSIHVLASGQIDARYHKMHPVMFGEYIPLGDWLPWLYTLSPMREGLARGQRPVAMQIGGLIFSPNICFESTVPHLIRRQTAQLRKAGKMPDVLVTQTNDGWFYGSSILDLHANCSLFRAVENGRPVLVAANGGITRWIDRRGRVQGELPRKRETYVIARCGKGQGATVYVRWGDWFALGCLCATVLGLAIPFAYALPHGRLGESP